MKTKTLTHDDIKNKLIESMVNNDITETDELNKKAEEVKKPKDAAAVIKQYEEIIRTKKKRIITNSYHQGTVFKKFKDKGKLIEILNEFKVHRTTMIFTMNVFKL